jgi:hypothetical protein
VVLQALPLELLQVELPLGSMNWQAVVTKVMDRLHYQGLWLEYQEDLQFMGLRQAQWEVLLLEA